MHECTRCGGGLATLKLTPQPPSTGTIAYQTLSFERDTFSSARGYLRSP